METIVLLLFWALFHCKDCLSRSRILNIKITVIILFCLYDGNSYNTVRCRYNVVQYFMILHTILQSQQQNIRLWTHKKHPIPRPHGRDMGCLLAEFLEKIDCVITASHCSKMASLYWHGPLVTMDQHPLAGGCRHHIAPLHHSPSVGYASFAMLIVIFFPPSLALVAGTVFCGIFLFSFPTLFLGQLHVLYGSLLSPFINC